MAVATYYFDGYTDNTNWGFPERMVDNNLANFASAGIASILTLNSNTCVTALTGAIQTVELRVYGKAGAGNRTNNRTQLIPIFDNGNGDNHISQWTSTTASWSEWFNITYDTNAPIKWTWSDIINFQCYCQSINHSSSNKIAKVEMRVTYSSCNDCDTFSIAGDSYTVLLSAPIWGGEDNKIVKDIDRKSFWSGNYEVNDDGINSQPLVLTGVEFASCEDDLCGISFESDAHFSLCFNMKFTNKMRFITEMSNNNEEVTISGLGDCMDGVYIIKHFHYDNIKGAINAYAWNMTLEKVRGN
jgi:hypothetical protein